MSATNSFETALLALIFNGTTIANLAINATSSPATIIYVSLHTADPGDAGAQNTAEAAYTGYARAAVNRNSGGWAISGDEATNVADIIFGQATGGVIADITHVGVGLASSGAGTLLISLALNNTVVMAVGSTPEFGAEELIFTCA